MSTSKKLVVNLSEKLYIEFNKALEKDSKKRSEFFREAVILYIEEKKRLSYIDEMKQGYLEMAELNLEIAGMGFEIDIKDFKEYEVKLSESDLSNDNNSEKRRYILC
ncbi:CopG family transcriptional regulator [Clostridium bowmanii]|uniref:CopG family transcriptional regulator n=1 Tax=Clostridium bowmanii TaxID=132925 RepID=UPI001C0D0D61|nr:CopG family transcriptional regulator [Clostridium bowmanii]MBU3189394.1 CopG family transcriptional regulator [Clostridium bowmanii]MCA1074008.1 CopG family transcriptional regulator [Clostridium bowmanii]